MPYLSEICTIKDLHKVSLSLLYRSYKGPTVYNSAVLTEMLNILTINNLI
jgi:hypothetical protein